MDLSINVSNLVNAGLFSLLGLMLFGGGFYFFDKITPYHLWKEIIEKQNTALAIVVAGMSIGICLIVAGAIHG